MITTKRDLGNLYQGLLSVESLTGAKFSYAVARNIKLLEPEMESLKKAGSMSKDFADYEMKRIEIAEKYAYKDDGKARIKDDKYEIEDKKSFEAELAALQKDNEKVIADRKHQLTEFKELLDSEIEIELFTIPAEYVPDSINTKQMADILPIIKE